MIRGPAGCVTLAAALICFVAVGGEAGPLAVAGSTAIEEDPHALRVFPPIPPRQARVKIGGRKFDPRKKEELRNLVAAIDHEIRRSDPQDSGTRDSRESDRPPDGGNDRSRPLGKSKDHIGPTQKEALIEMRALALEATESSEIRPEAVVRILEIGDALDHNSKQPAPKRIDLLQLPFAYIDVMHNPVGIGKEHAWNLPPAAARAAEDSSMVDPAPSTFWTRPKDIPSRDLYGAFGPILSLGEEVCIYDEPKTSYGTSPGFSVKCGDRTVKVKFGETENSKRNSEVAVTRIFGALGFNVEPNDYAPEVRVRYDRRIFLEFNSRKQLTTRITALGFIPVFAIKIQKEQDAFRFIRYAVTKDGSILSVGDLRKRLIRPEILQGAERSGGRLPGGSSPEHYREDAGSFENEIDYLVMEEANVQLRDSGGRNIGPWDWDRLDHPRRRELRGAGLLAAWTNYFDTRWDNNRLKYVDTDGRKELKHFISDLGNSLGRAENIKVDAQGLVNDFPWTFTDGPVIDKKGRVKKPFRILKYQPMFDNRSFREMTVDDARWMARLIAQLTENQLKQALIATGYVSAEVKLYTEKLISRRDKMIQDLRLAREIGLLRPNGIDRAFDYDPRRDGPVTARAGDGGELRPLESRDLVVRRGRVEPR